MSLLYTLIFVFFNDPATTEIYTLSLHDALPISSQPGPQLRAGLEGVQVDALVLQAAPQPLDEHVVQPAAAAVHGDAHPGLAQDRKSTRLNSSHANISYAVFCLKKKTKLNCTSTN